MAIKTYTSNVDANKSLAEIQQSLAEHGARKIMVEYNGEARPCSVMFYMETSRGPCGFSLPANVEGVRRVFIKQKIKDVKGQVERTAWRNLRDWVLAQMAIVEAGQAELEEVFLPYLTDGQGKTLYQAFSSGLLALGDGEEITYE